MKRRRVKITGIGPVTPAGIGRDEFWKGILEPVSRVRPFTKLGEEYGPLVAATVERFDIGKFADRDAVPKGSARHTLFAIAAAALALRDAGIKVEDLGGTPSAVITGSSIMDFGGIVRGMDAVGRRGPKFAQPRTIHSAGIGSVPSAINQTLGLNGRTVAISNHCSSGMDAIGYAASLVAAGEIDIAICGGADAPLNRAPLLELRAGEIISFTAEMAERQARPFDLWRTAGAVGEGAAMMVLEPEDAPRMGYCYISGYAFANDATNDLCGGMYDAARLALSHALIRPEQVDALNAWGPGDRRVDKGEACAMKKLFGVSLPELPTVSIKGAIGSPLGAAPAIQLSAAALGLRSGGLPPTVNWEYPDPDCPFNLSRAARALPHNITLVNAHGFGAVNSAMVLQRC